jgi:hypothetical protein
MRPHPRPQLSQRTPAGRSPLASRHARCASHDAQPAFCGASRLWCQLGCRARPQPPAQLDGLRAAGHWPSYADEISRRTTTEKAVAISDVARDADQLDHRSGPDRRCHHDVRPTTARRCPLDQPRATRADPSHSSRTDHAVRPPAGTRHSPSIGDSPHPPRRASSRNFGERYA